jgi:predicted enzyme related to lactoylglutathione lyase
VTSFLVNIDVDELERGIAFYVSAFGLSVGRRFGTEAVELLGAAVPVYLLVKPTGSLPFSGASEPRTYRPHWSPVHLDFVVQDIDAAIARARAAGAAEEGPVGDHAWGRLALLRDPFGHGFCLIEFRGRGYDEIATG